jgi:hypothetical protein
MLEPYAVKVARTVLRGGKAVRPYLSQLDTLLVHTVNNECRLLVKISNIINIKTLHLGSTRAT